MQHKTRVGLPKAESWQEKMETLVRYIQPFSVGIVQESPFQIPSSRSSTMPRAGKLPPPSLAEETVNYNEFESGPVSMMYDDISSSGMNTFSGVLNSPGNDTALPRSYLASPIYDTFMVNENKQLVAMLLSQISWYTRFESILPIGANGVVLVVRYACTGKADVDHSYSVNGPDVVYMGPGDLHAHPRWTYYEYPADVPVFHAGGNCSYSLHIYPSDRLNASFTSNKPAIYTSIVVLIFLVTSTVFVW